MRVTIIAVIVENTALLVKFSSIPGVGFAKWGGNDEPFPGQYLDVEIEIDETIYIGKNAHLQSQHVFEMSHDSKSLTLSGFVEDQDDDGLVYLRISTDCLLMIESVEPNLAGRWIELEVPASSVKLYPTGSVNI